MQMSLYADMPTLAAGGVMLNKNEVGYFGVEWLSRGDGIKFVAGDILFNAEAGDEISLTTFVSAAPDGGALMAEYFSTYNKIYLFKL